MDQLVKTYRNCENECLIINEVASKVAKIWLRQVHKFYRRLYKWGAKLGPHCKILRLFDSIVFIKSLSNLEFKKKKILRRSFLWCRRVFANWSMSIFEKKTCKNVFLEGRLTRIGCQILCYYFFFCSKQKAKGHFLLCIRGTCFNISWTRMSQSA